MKERQNKDYSEAKSGEPQAHGTSGLPVPKESFVKIELNSTVCNF